MLSSHLLIKADTYITNIVFILCIKFTLHINYTIQLVSGFYNFYETFSVIELYNLLCAYNTPLKNTYIFEKIFGKPYCT